MLEILKQAVNDKAALLVILAVMMMAIGGSYKLVTGDIQEVSADVRVNTKELYKRNDIIHDLDKRLTVLEVKNDN